MPAYDDDDFDPSDSYITPSKRATSAAPPTPPPPPSAEPLTEDGVAELEEQAALAKRAASARAILVRDRLLSLVLSGEIAVQSKDVAGIIRALTPKPAAGGGGLGAGETVEDEEEAALPPDGLLRIVGGE